MLLFGWRLSYIYNQSVEYSVTPSPPLVFVYLVVRLNLFSSLPGLSMDSMLSMVSLSVSSYLLFSRSLDWTSLRGAQVMELLQQPHTELLPLPTTPQHPRTMLRRLHTMLLLGQDRWKSHHS